MQTIHRRSKGLLDFVENYRKLTRIPIPMQQLFPVSSLFDDLRGLVGFGTFEVSERAAREGRNPQTGETMKIAASKAPKFKAGKALKDMVNE